jgi:hypothetical protein
MITHDLPSLKNLNKPVQVRVNAPAECSHGLHRLRASNPLITSVLNPRNEVPDGGRLNRTGAVVLLTYFPVGGCQSTQINGRRDGRSGRIPYTRRKKIAFFLDFD